VRANGASAGAGGATNVPRPTRETTRPRAASISYACDTVTSATSSCAASARIGGSRESGASAPPSIDAVSASAI
jgi:hypothetical protein